MGQPEDKLWVLDREKYIDQIKPDPLQIQQIQGWQIEAERRKISSKDSIFTPTDIHCVQLKWNAKYIQILLDIECYWNETNFSVSIHASSEFLKPSGDDSKSTKKIIKRLQQDDYIQKLHNNPTKLCECQISADSELVDTSEEVAEAIRRSVFSRADSTLDIIELLCFLPVFSKTNLGQRARLKLLEDAAVDACDNELDVDELSLANNGPSTKKTKR